MLGSAERSVLRELVLGCDRGAVASRLFISTRSVDAKIARIKQGLGTDIRMVIGIRAVRHELIEPHIVIKHTLTNRPGLDWVPPEVRQTQILDMLAAGMTYHHVAAALMVGIRTVERALQSLCVANCVVNGVPAGALFAALRFVGDR